MMDTEQAMMSAPHPGQFADTMSADNKRKYQIPGLENSIRQKGMQLAWCGWNREESDFKDDAI